MEVEVSVEQGTFAALGFGFRVGVWAEVVVEGAFGGFVEFFRIEGFVGGMWISRRVD